MKKRNLRVYVTSMLLLCSTGLLHAQKESYNWFFGHNNVYKFGPTGSVATLTSNNTTTANSAMVTGMGSGTASDANGNLLFYTDAETIWGPGHTPISNGTGISGSKLANMGVAIAKQPMSTANALQHIVFTVSYTNQLYYSVVKKGVLPATPAAVISKNQLLSAAGIEMSQKMAITNASNCSDVWVVTHDYGNRFYAYKITLAGISAPVVSFFPTVSVAKKSFGSFDYNIGCMKISPDGKLLAMNYEQGSGAYVSQCTLFRFDNTTGVVSGIGGSLPYTLEFPVDEDANTPDIGLPIESLHDFYGAEFSPNSKVLYVTAQSDNNLGLFCSTSTCGGIGGFGCIQMNVSSLVPSTITASRRIAAKGAGGMLQLGPDGRIYTGEAFTNFVVLSGDNTRGAIEKPHLMNLGPCSNECSYHPAVAINSVPNPATACGSGLPLLNSSYFNNIAPPDLTATPQSFCPGAVTTITLTANVSPGVNIKWRSGSCSGPIIGTSNALVVAAPTVTTTYYAQVTNSCGFTSICSSVTVTVLGGPTSMPAIFGNTTVCNGGNTTLSIIPTGGNSYYWYDANNLMVGNNVSSITFNVTASTTYYLQVVGPGGCASKPIAIPITLGTVDIGPMLNGATCGECLNMGGMYGTPDYTYSWSPATNLSSATDANPVYCPHNDPGPHTYTVTVTDGATGCAETFSQYVNNGSVSYDAGYDGILNDPVCPPASSAIFGIPNSTLNTYTITPMTYVTFTYPDGTFEVSHPGGFVTPIDVMYIITATSPVGCESTDTVVVSFTDLNCHKSAQFELDEINETTFSQLMIVPNPSRGIIKVYSTVAYESRYIMRITDYSGRIVFTSVLSGNSPMEINLTSQPRGIYLVTIMNNQGIETKKLILD